MALSVGDTGTGMPPSVLDRAFEPFFTQAAGAGLGLGLAMVYGLMKQHGGFVDVASTPGHGATVTLLFPVAEAPAVPPAPVSPRPPRRGTILLVEDEPALRRAAQAAARRPEPRFRVFTAADGQEGLELARVHRDELDLVLSDVVMPRMGGPAMHAALAREGITVPFLFTSGYTGREMPDGIPLPPDVPLLPKPWEAQSWWRGWGGRWGGRR